MLSSIYLLSYLHCDSCCHRLCVVLQAGHLTDYRNRILIACDQKLAVCINKLLATVQTRVNFKDYNFDQLAHIHKPRSKL